MLLPLDDFVPEYEFYTRKMKLETVVRDEHRERFIPLIKSDTAIASKWLIELSIFANYLWKRIQDDQGYFDHLNKTSVNNMLQFVQRKKPDVKGLIVDLSNYQRWRHSFDMPVYTKKDTNHRSKIMETLLNQFLTCLEENIVRHFFSRLRRFLVVIREMDKKAASNLAKEILDGTVEDQIQHGRDWNMLGWI